MRLLVYEDSTFLGSPVTTLPFGNSASFKSPNSQTQPISHHTLFPSHLPFLLYIFTKAFCPPTPMDFQTVSETDNSNRQVNQRTEQTSFFPPQTQGVVSFKHMLKIRKTHGSAAMKI